MKLLNIGAILDHIRKEENCDTDEELAVVLGQSKQVISNWRKRNTQSAVDKILERYKNIDVEQFYIGKEPVKEKSGISEKDYWILYGKYEQLQNEVFWQRELITDGLVQYREQAQNKPQPKQQEENPPQNEQKPIRRVTEGSERILKAHTDKSQAASGVP